MSIIFCVYGCNQEAKFQTKAGKWICDTSPNRCPTLNEKRGKIISKHFKDNPEIAKRQGQFSKKYFSKAEREMCEFCKINRIKKKLAKHIENCKFNPKNKPLYTGKCKKCGKEHTGLIGNGSFCSRKCAASRIVGEETRQKRIKTIHRKIKEGSWKLFGYKRRDYPNIEKIDRKCVICSVIFKVKPYDNKQTCGSRKCLKLLLSKKKTGTGFGKKNGMYGKAPTTANYKHGVFISERFNKKINYRSSYEKKALELLESDPLILSYEYEKLCIPYFNGKSDRTVIPDFLITYKDGKRVIVEIKPKEVMDIWDNPMKREVVSDYCKKNNLKFEVWTEKELQL